jgi:hypothetical protein
MESYFIRKYDETERHAYERPQIQRFPLPGASGTLHCYSEKLKIKREPRCDIIELLGLILTLDYRVWVETTRDFRRHAYPDILPLST